jgi:hypothetical protein
MQPVVSSLCGAETGRKLLSLVGGAACPDAPAMRQRITLGCRAPAIIHQTSCRGRASRLSFPRPRRDTRTHRIVTITLRPPLLVSRQTGARRHAPSAGPFALCGRSRLGGSDFTRSEGPVPVDPVHPGAERLDCHSRNISPPGDRPCRHRSIGSRIHQTQFGSTSSAGTAIRVLTGPRDGAAEGGRVARRRSSGIRPQHHRRPRQRIPARFAAVAP